MPVEVAMANQQTLNLVFDQTPTASNPFKWQNCDDEPWSFVRTKNYSVIGDLLRAMATKEGTVKPGLLNTFAQNLSFYQVLRESTMLKEIHHLLITKIGKGLDSDMTAFVEHFYEKPRSPYTPFIELCKRYANFPKRPIEISSSDVAASRYLKLVGIEIGKDMKEIGFEENYSRARELISFFIESFNPVYRQTVEVEAKGSDSKGKTQKLKKSTSALLEIVEATDPDAEGLERPGFELVWQSYNHPVEDLNLLDERELNGLMRAIQESDFSRAILLVERGADVNKVFKDFYYNQIGEKHIRATTPIIEAIKKGSLRLVESLLKTGRLDLNQEGVEDFVQKENCKIGKLGLVQHAVTHASNHRDDRERIAIVELLVNKFKARAF